MLNHSIACIAVWQLNEIEVLMGLILNVLCNRCGELLVYTKNLLRSSFTARMVVSTILSHA